MPQRSDNFCGLVTLVVWWFYTAGGYVAEGKSFYISRSSGSDSWICDQKNPCNTIWRAVTLASHDDRIYLDGTNTDKDPYTCLGGTSVHPDICITKSLSLIGYGNPLPQIRCSKGTSLTFNGSVLTEEMHVTLTGLTFRQSSIAFHDSSANMENCKFDDNKESVKFETRNKIVSRLHIIDSTFSGNKECIAVVVNGATIRHSQDIQVLVTLKNSSFNGNILSNEGTCISFTESLHTNQTLSCNIILENVMFSRNKFNSRGLVFLEMDTNGNQNIHFQNVTFLENSGVSLGRDVSTGQFGDRSECIVRSSRAAVTILINSSRFKSQSARSFDIIASHISLLIYYSSFIGHKVAGNGGVISLTGTDRHELRTLNVSNSSFVNSSAAQGGAINFECINACSVSFKDCIFTGNTATALNGGGGGAVYIGSPESIIKGAKNATDTTFGEALSMTSSGTCLVTIERSTFSNNNAEGSNGGAISISTKSQTSLVLQNVTMESNRAKYSGGAIDIFTIFSLVVDQSLFCDNTLTYKDGSGGGISIRNMESSGAGNLIIERSTFSNNHVNFNGGAIFIHANNQSVLRLQSVAMLSNSGEKGGGAVAINSIYALEIYNSRFLNNIAFSNRGGAIYVDNANKLEVQGCHFHSNYAGGQAGYGGAMCVTSESSASVLVTNSTFYNCCTQTAGGAFYLRTKYGNVYLEVTRSLFVKNHVLENFGGAMAIYVEPDTRKDPGLINPRFQRNLLFQDTTFERNTADFGGALHLSNGEAEFQNCSFINNFALNLGGHIQTEPGTTSLCIRGSVFNQTINELQLGDKKYSTGTFIATDSSGTLTLTKTSLNISIPRSNSPLLQVRNGRQVDVDNSTMLSCPVGSKMQIIHFQDEVKSVISCLESGKLFTTLVTTVEVSCSVCEGNTYSLQRGRAFGLYKASGFECPLCPFGANCSQNIVAEPNFWGFEQVSPPKLQFTMCPMGYCASPKESEFPDYNSCQGNRSGILCGHCKESYTETLYSTNCRASHECKDNWIWPVALVYVSIMALYFTFKPPIIPLIKNHLLWFKEHGPSNQDTHFDSGYLKIIFYFYQAANLLLVSESAGYFLKTKFMGPLVGLFNFQLKFSPKGFICPFPGLTVVTKQLLIASHVFATFLMIGIFYSLHWGIHKVRRREAPSFGPYIGGIFQTMLLGYSTFASVSFNLLRCVPIGWDKRLFYDGNVVCFEWWQYLLLAFDCAFFVPFVFVLLWGSFKLYGRTISVGKFLLACCLPLPTLLYWLCVALLCRTRPSPNEELPLGQSSMISVERVLYDSFKRPEEGKKLSLGWEGIMIGRRLILILLEAFISNPMSRLFTMTFFGVLFLLHHSLTQPFRNGIANILETISLLCLVMLGTVNTFFASFQSFAVPLDKSPFTPLSHAFKVVEIVILCFVPVVFFLLVVAAVLSLVCRLIVAAYNIICHLPLALGCFKWHYSKRGDEVSPMLV
ncbi:uncharacterized protein [Montipora foliosa]|uniref:uncharacterized protein n=1 Tax=Montipora foliosa TaxID=591990 RepID=UPI0035F19DEB